MGEISQKLILADSQVTDRITIAVYCNWCTERFTDSRVQLANFSTVTTRAL